MPSTSYFETRFVSRPERQFVWKAVAEYLERRLPASAVTLELGAGYCEWIGSQTAARRIAVDIDVGLIDRAPAGVEAIVGSCESIPELVDCSVDRVLVSNLFEHLDRPSLAATLAEIRRVLRPDGVLAAVHPNFRLNPHRYFDDYTHVTVLSDTSVSDLLEASGFEVFRCEPRFLPLTMKSRFSSGYRLVPYYLRLPVRPFAGQMLHLARKRID